MSNKTTNVNVLQTDGQAAAETGVTILQRDPAGNISLAQGTAANKPSAAAGYAKGAKYIATDTGAWYNNTGTTSSCTFSLIASITAGSVTGADLSTGVGYFTVAVATNGTTPVNVFGAGGAPVALVVTSVLSVAKDTTASNIILKQAANTVATIAKGTVAGVTVGAATLANATYAAADVCTVESSGTGNSFVIITFTVA